MVSGIRDAPRRPLRRCPDTKLEDQVYKKFRGQVWDRPLFHEFTRQSDAVSPVQSPTTVASQWRVKPVEIDFCSNNPKEDGELRSPTQRPPPRASHEPARII